MIKYQEVLDCIVESDDWEERQYYGFILKELVDKATPMNVHNCSLMANTTNVWLCPECKGFVSIDDNYCSSCGQRIEWK